MSRQFAITLGAAVAWVLCAGGASAFEQNKPVAPVGTPPAAGTLAAPQADAPRQLLLDQAEAGSTEKNQNKGLKIPGLNKVIQIPKLNFGLDVMYGASKADDSNLGFDQDPAGANDVRLMGKVKRRF